MRTKILPINEESLAEACEILLCDGLVAFPTETVYGLGALGTSPYAVMKIFEVKGRPTDNPLIAHVHKDFDISELVEVEHDYVNKIKEAFMPGPLTLVLKSKEIVTSVATCNLDTLAIRMPSHPGCQEFLAAIDMPIVAPSANRSMHVSPVTAQHVYDDLSGKIPLILDGGMCTGGIESTIVDCTGEVPLILRSGLITREMIQDVAGKCEYADALVEGQAPKAPGMKYKHYSPSVNTMMFGRDNLAEARKLYDAQTAIGKMVYFICDDTIAAELNNCNVIKLGSSSEEIADNLYEKLRSAESICDLLIGVELDVNNGVDRAVMNRFGKACKG